MAALKGSYPLASIQIPQSGLGLFGHEALGRAFAVQTVSRYDRIGAKTSHGVAYWLLPRTLPWRLGV